MEGDSATDLDVARMDSDNLDDIVVVNDSTFDLNLGAIVFGAGNGRFRVNNPFVVDFGATSITLADFDAASDRAMDAIIGFAGDDSTGVRANTGDGTGDLRAIHSRRSVRDPSASWPRSRPAISAATRCRTSSPSMRTATRCASPSTNRTRRRRRPARRRR